MANRRRRYQIRGFFRDSALMGVMGFTGSTAVLAQVSGVAPTVPGGELTALVTQTGITGLLIFFLVQSMRRETEAAKGYALDLKEMADKQSAQSEKLMTAVLERLPRAEKGKTNG